MASVAEERLRILDGLGSRLEEFQYLVRQRRQAGVEGRYEQVVLEESLARWQRMAEADAAGPAEVNQARLRLLEAEQGQA